MLQEIQVRGGLKNDPIRQGGGGVDFFWNNPIETTFTIAYSSFCYTINGKTKIQFILNVILNSSRCFFKQRIFVYKKEIFDCNCLLSINYFERI